MKKFQIDVPRDRNGEFEPKLIPKYQRDISGIEEKVISLYTHKPASLYKRYPPEEARRIMRRLEIKNMNQTQNTQQSYSGLAEKQNFTKMVYGNINKILRKALL